MNEREGERLTPAAIKAGIDKGMDLKSIGEIYGVSKQAVSSMAKRYNVELPKTVRDRVKELYPLRVETAHQNCSPFKRTRDHTEFLLTRGKDMAVEKLKRLDSWYDLMDSYVLVYNPDIGSIKGTSSVGGWEYVERTKEDGRALFRENEYLITGPKFDFLNVLPESDSRPNYGK